MKKFEIKVYDSWTQVSWNVFRSWGGPRRVNGKDFHGPVFYFLTFKRMR